MSDVPQGTVQEVLDWVGDDPGRAQEAIDAEQAGAQRSTLLTQLESICPSKEAPVSESTTNDETVDETEQAPGPEQPLDVALAPGDNGVFVGPLIVREGSDPLDELPIDPEAEELPGEQVETLQAAVGPNGCALAINGEIFLFDQQMTAAARMIADQAIVGMSL